MGSAIRALIVVAFLLGCQKRRPLAPSCGEFAAIRRSCAPCNVTSTMSEAAARKLAQQAHEALLRGEMSGEISVVVPTGARWRTYFWSDTGAKEFSAAPDASYLPDLASAERLVGDDLPLLSFLEIRTDGYSDTDGIILEVTAHRRDWIPEDQRMVESDDVDIYYCARRSGNHLTFTRLYER